MSIYSIIQKMMNKSKKSIDDEKKNEIKNKK